MRFRFVVAVMSVGLGLAACSPDRGVGAAGAWVGTITTEGAVTTVVNESGSVWGGTARLVEVASIGVDEGPEEYMLGYVDTLHLTSDRIYVIDGQVPAVRAYDHEGRFVTGFGRAGQGPGEYLSPGIVTADESGRVFVLDARLSRINVYASSGESLETWPFEGSSCCVQMMFPLADGTIWKPVNRWSETAGERFGVQAVGPTGSGEITWVPEVEVERATYVAARAFDAETPFSPRMCWSPMPDGGLVVGGSDRYHYEVHSPRGERLIVERTWEPIPIAPEHKEWARRWQIAFDRALNDPDQDLDASLVPDHLPAYIWMVPGSTGEIWFLRHAASEPLADCAGDPFEVGYRAARERPCWRSERIIDVFGADGRYLGVVDVPNEMVQNMLPLSISGSIVAGLAQDDAGTYMVKLYRLVVPGEGGS